MESGSGGELDELGRPGPIPTFPKGKAISKYSDRIVNDDVVVIKFGFVMEHRSLPFGEGEGGRGYTPVKKINYEDKRNFNTSGAQKLFTR